ncbi:AfsR/SARP family transcriptional regulator [Amycolatopsis taiwanensis]|uniref:OmpR/PhoB-type domain-containing protein n=1 Tax=Amycolatopsis taiwanensis TaxID=342230 RepID=A0A9W6VH34_9PSEU|nr:BTAD domain-containing putative transcriptional regulator [Amycolatopsis taiwanensis]GLY71498.1 hypothetical protein Atai01_81170 [Amycolatopsis taiwanensis]
MIVLEPYLRLLGPFELVHQGRPVPVGGPVAQAILAALSYAPDTKVLPGRLIAMVWGNRDAVTVDNLYHFVSRLRRALAPAGLRIVGHRPGYRLPVSAAQVDAVRFEELLRSAQALRDTDPDQAARRLRAALQLWRGTSALDNLNQRGIRRIADALDVRRLDAEEDLADLELGRGRPELVLDRLRTLAVTHPERPRLAAALIRALHATGRLDQARRALAEAEHAAGRDGAHPALAHARRVVSGGPRFHPPACGAVGVPGAVPFQLPADTIHFTGRAHDLARMLALWPAGDGEPAPGTVVVSAVRGMAGIGKTALAVHAAHRLAPRFADGVLFADLRGFTPDADPVPPTGALDHLLRGLGVPGPQIPPGLDARATLYRTVLAGRRVLIVLDNAADEAQVRPLIPSAPGCLVLITSRRHLAGLDDATHLALRVLPRAEAAALFRALAGDRATAADRDSVERIVALCGHLPLAIRITAARLRLGHATNPAKLLAELADELGAHRRLSWFSDGDRSVLAALAVSYRHLTAPQQHAFRLLGLHPGADIDPHALAALADTTPDHAQRLLDELHAASLTDQPAYRRYTLHELVATYVTQLADEEWGT